MLEDGGLTSHEQQQIEESSHQLTTEEMSARVDAQVVSLTETIEASSEMSAMKSMLDESSYLHQHIPLSYKIKESSGIPYYSIPVNFRPSCMALDSGNNLYVHGVFTTKLTKFLFLEDFVTPGTDSPPQKRRKKSEEKIDINDYNILNNKKMNLYYSNVHTQEVNLGFSIRRVTIDKDNDDFIVTNESPERHATIIKYDGTVLQTFGKFNSPDGVALNPQNKHIFVCDSYNHKIHEYTREGGFIRFFKSSDCKYPTTLAFNNHNQLVVLCDSKVIVFSVNEGKRIFSVGPFVDKTQTEPFDSPRGLAVEGSEVYVSDKNKIRIFDVNTRKMVYTFDSHPMEAHQKLGFDLIINERAGNSLIVSEFNNNCINIFS